MHNKSTLTCCLLPYHRYLAFPFLTSHRLHPHPPIYTCSIGRVTPSPSLSIQMSTKSSTTTTSSTFSTNANTTPAAPYLLTSQSPLPSLSSPPGVNVRFPSAIGLKSMERAKPVAMSSEIMDFVGRYQTLQGYQAASDQLMKVGFAFPFHPLFESSFPFPTLQMGLPLSFLLVCRGTKAPFQTHARRCKAYLICSSPDSSIGLGSSAQSGPVRYISPWLSGEASRCTMPRLLGVSPHRLCPAPLPFACDARRDEPPLRSCWNFTFSHRIRVRNAR